MFSETCQRLRAAGSQIDWSKINFLLIKVFFNLSSIYLLSDHLITPSTAYQSNFWPVTGTALRILFIMSVSNFEYICSRSIWYYEKKFMLALIWFVDGNLCIEYLPCFLCCWLPWGFPWGSSCLSKQCCRTSYRGWIACCPSRSNGT